MKIRTLLLSVAATFAFVSVTFGQAASSDAAKPKVVITDDNLAQQLPAQPAGDDANTATQAPAAVVMTADEISALEAAIAEKRGTIKDVEEHIAAAKQKVEET